jgi:hypothetical protein
LVNIKFIPLILSALRETVSILLLELQKLQRLGFGFELKTLFF